ncbi:MAG: oligosaccharide flippase family protein [Melioribacteraceae bacterium]|nr:oligosaccharide flippase family protein [Melioribacteraceae bacterium]
MTALKRNIKAFFKTDLSYLVKNGGWLVISQIISFITTLLLASAFANLISQENYGTYKYFLTLISLFSIFTLSGMNTAISRSVGNGVESSVYLGLKTKMKWGMLGSIASLATAIYYLVQGNTEFALTLLIISLLMPFRDSLAVYQVYLSGKKLFRIVATNGIQINLITTLVLLITLFYTNKVWIIIATTLVVPTFLNSIYFYINLKKYPPHDTNEDTSLSDGVHLSIMGGLGTITGSLQGIALWHFLGPVGLAIYSFALAPIEQIRPFLRFIETLFLPKIAKDSWELPSFTFFIKKLFPFVLTISFGVVLYILLIPYVYKILFPAYLDSIIYSQILSIGLIFTAVQIVTYTILKAKKQTKHLYTLNTGTIISDLVIVIPATYFFGIFGLIFSILVQKIVTIIATFFILFKTK